MGFRIETVLKNIRSELCELKRLTHKYSIEDEKYNRFTYFSTDIGVRII